jgi:hypothetical protein
MTKFEQFLISKGYLKYTFDYKKNEYEVANGHVISSLSNLSHTYFYKYDIDEDSGEIKLNANQILFGLNQEKRPATLISPRPRIEIKRIRNGKEIIECEQYDDSMNYVLGAIDFEEIFEAMYDRSICFEIDLTNQANQ